MMTRNVIKDSTGHGTECVEDVVGYVSFNSSRHSGKFQD
jgi:hypothetical protein